MRNKAGTLTKEEVTIVKALLSKGWRNQDIQALVNIGRAATINGARITEVKQNKVIAAASDAEMNFFIRKKRSFDPVTGLNFFDDERLIRAREAMALAVQIFNSPTLRFKTEVFSILVNVAWTYLLHEFYIRRKVKIIGEDGRTLLLSQMLKRQDCPLTAGMKKNLEAIKLIRDEVEHNLLGRSDLKWLSLFQASCLNFDKVIREQFGEALSLQNELAFALQFARLNVDQISDIQKYEIPGHIEALDARLREGMTEEEMSDLDYQFRVVYTLDSASKSRSHIQFINPNSDEAKEIQNVLMKYKSADELYPHKPGVVVALVAKRSGKRFNGHNHTQAWRKFKVRPRAGAAKPDATNKEYCIYHAAHKDYTYSERWVEFLVAQIATEEGYSGICSLKI
ncbi:MAG TPA: DUF3644 domain-containing protein [Gemmataceae bacterium]|nr:DUF3644 domain-containing protein [Gemmataceae bacterium]